MAASADKTEALVGPSIAVDGNPDAYTQLSAGASGRRVLPVVQSGLRPATKRLDRKLGPKCPREAVAHGHQLGLL
jgi:hypothetical protein